MSAFTPAVGTCISSVYFNCENDIPEPTERETLDYLLRFSAFGGDRGVVLPLAGSDNQQFDFSEVQDRHLAKQEKYRKRWQKRFARWVKGSSGSRKAKQKIARHQRYGSNVRSDVAHQTSHTLASDQRYKIYVLEALKVQNMTKKARLKKDEQGRWIKNGARTKSGLNKSILGSVWGKTRVLLQYKARSKGKLVLEVPLFYSSLTRTTGYLNPSLSARAVEILTMPTIMG